jgi:hypothetical protein
MNDLIRAAAGRRVHVATSTAPEPPIGDLGGGRGGTCAPRPVRETDMAISDTIRDAAGIVRRRVTLDDLWTR